MGVPTNTNDRTWFPTTGAPGYRLPPPPGPLPATERGSDQENHQEPSSPSVLLAGRSPALLLDRCGVRSGPTKVVEGSVQHCTLLGD